MIARWCTPPSFAYAKAKTLFWDKAGLKHKKTSLNGCLMVGMSGLEPPTPTLSGAFPKPKIFSPMP